MFSLKSRSRKLFTMIELMIVVIIVAILAASAVPLYRASVSRAYQAEISSALGTIRSAQRMYYAENNRYANDLDDLELTAGDFRDMSHLYADDFEIADWQDMFSLGAGEDDGEPVFVAVWFSGDENAPNDEQIAGVDGVDVEGTDIVVDFGNDGAGYGDGDFPGDFTWATINQAGDVQFHEALTD